MGRRRLFAPGGLFLYLQLLFVSRHVALILFSLNSSAGAGVSAFTAGI
jgi:hypothetical protein